MKPDILNRLTFEVLENMCHHMNIS